MGTSITDLVDDLVAADGAGASVRLPHEVMHLGLDAARQVRSSVIHRLCEVRGARVSGYKVGLTSPPAQSAMGAHEPVYGELLDEWIVRSPARITHGELHCAVVEAELSFVFDEPLSPNATHDEVVAKSRVAAALDVPDSRYLGWYPLPEAVLVDMVADNSFAGRLVVGEAIRSTASVDLVEARVELRFNGRVVDRGTGASVLGDPVASVVWLSRQLAESRRAIAAGDVVSAGTLTAPVVGRPGVFEADFGELGVATLEISPA